MFQKTKIGYLFEMLGSLNSSSTSSHHRDDEAAEEVKPQNWHAISHSSSAAAHQLRRLLISCAELVALSDFPAAHRLVSLLLSNCSPYGDSMERLVHQFAKALSVRISRHHRTEDSRIFISGVSGNDRATDSIINTTTVFTSNICKEHYAYCSNLRGHDYFQSCYLWLNQMTPFTRFSHLTANQAILDAVELGQKSAMHILDLDIAQGLQWPPLMQALSERSDGTPPLALRITGCGGDLNLLNRTGDRLTRFAHSLGLRFQFHPILVHEDDPAALAFRLRPSTLSLVPDEALAVNCVLCLHKMLSDDPRDILLLLRAIKELNPKIVTVAEKEANHNHPTFLQRLTEALNHYAAVFESLEATLPPNSHERASLEQSWFGREILDIVAAQGQERKLRHQVFELWEALFRSSGFSTVPLSGFALSQAKVLLRLHYPSEGYQLQIIDNSLYLGWQNRLLFSVSSWR